MRKQQQIWQQEHFTAASLPDEMQKQSSNQPSQYILQFRDFLKKKKINQGKGVDIGAGKGRNSIYLAHEGFEMHALDYIQEAITHINTVAKQEKLIKKLHTYCVPIDHNWPFPNNYFNISINCFTSINIDT